MSHRASVFLVTFILLFASATLGLAFIELVQSDFAQFPKDALIILGTLAFMAFIGWLDAINDESKRSRSE